MEAMEETVVETVETIVEETEEHEYVCDRCDYRTTDRSNFQRHLSKKIPCPPIKSNILLEEIRSALNEVRDKDKYICCDFCDKVYSSRQGLYHHMKKYHPSENETVGQGILQPYIEKIKTLEEDLKDTIREYKLTLYSLQEALSELKEANSLITKQKQELYVLKSRRNEDFYQVIVEQYLQGKHKRVGHGVTDVSNETTHAEIKKYDDYKSAMGQLLAYNSTDPKDNLHMYLFGNYTSKVLANAYELLNKYNIQLFVFETISLYEINIKKYITNEVVFTYLVEQT